MLSKTVAALSMQALVLLSFDTSNKAF